MFSASKVWIKFPKTRKISLLILFSAEILAFRPLLLVLFSSGPKVTDVELVSKELNHFGVFADLFRQIGGHSTGFVLFCSFWRLFTKKWLNV